MYSHIIVLSAMLAVAGSFFSHSSSRDARAIRRPVDGYEPVKKEVRVQIREILSIGVEDGDPNYLFAKPTNVVVDGKGNIYVIEMFAKQVRKYDKSGKYLVTIGRTGKGPGEYMMPSFGAVDRADNFYLFDYTTMRLSTFQPDGTFEGSFVPGFLAGGICVSPKGEIVVCGIQDGKMLHQFDSKGKLISSFGEPWKASTDPRMGGFNFAFACLGPDTCVYCCPVTDPNEILKCDLRAKTVSSVAHDGPDYRPLTMSGKEPSGSMTRGMVVLRDGTIVVCVSFAKDNKSVERLDFYSKEGRYLVSSSEIHGTPRCVDRECGMYVVTSEPFPRVVKYSVNLQGS